MVSTPEGEMMSRNYDDRPKRSLPLIVLAIAALTIAACGATTSGTTATTGAAAGNELTVSVKEFEFTPNTWTVPAGGEVSIAITNDGTIDHEWVLLQEGVTIASEDELPDSEEELLESFVNVEEEVAPGETKTLTFTAPAAGTYQVICAIAGHFDSGMEGTLTSTG